MAFCGIQSRLHLLLRSENQFPGLMNNFTHVNFHSLLYVFILGGENLINRNLQHFCKSEQVIY